VDLTAANELRLAGQISSSNSIVIIGCSEGHLPREPGRAKVAPLGSSEIGYSLRVDVCWAPDRAPRCRCGSRSSLSTEG
jgi:hypothetical protein